MYAGYELAFKQSVTYSNSDITSAPLATSTDPDRAQTSVYGTQKLALDSSVYLRDDGQQSVFLPSSKKPLEAQDEGKAILAWLENPQPHSDTKEQLVKQATLGTPGDTFVFRGGAKLKDHIILGHAVATVSGDDLLISADPRSTTATPAVQTDNGYGYQNRAPAGSSYVIVTKANEINYLIQNNDNRFSEGIYMIAKNSNTIFNIAWNDDLGSPRMMYVHDKDRYDMYIDQDTITAPQKTELRFQPQYLAALTQPTV